MSDNDERELHYCSDECEEITEKSPGKCCICFVNINLERERKGEYSVLDRDVTKHLCGHCFQRWRKKMN